MHVADTLVVLGGAFLVCGLLARAGVRIGLPTIPLFMLAGISSGRTRPASTWSATPTSWSWSPASAWSSCCSTSGWSSRSTSSSPAAGGCSRRAGIYLALNIGGGLALGLALGWGTAEALRDGRRRRHLVVGDRHQAAGRDPAAGQPGDPGDPRHHRHRGRVPGPLPGAAAAGARRAPTARSRPPLGIATAFGFLLAAARWSRATARTLVGRLVDTATRRSSSSCSSGWRSSPPGVAEQLGVSDAIGAFMVGLDPRPRPPQRGPAAHARPPAARRVRRRSSSSPSG